MEMEPSESSEILAAVVDGLDKRHVQYAGQKSISLND